MKPTKKSVDEIIADLPKHEQVVVKRLRALVLECLPKATEKNNYGVPFYTRNRMICFIWPPSIYWGPKKSDYQQKGVSLGFCQGNLFANDDGALLAEGRKQVYCMYFTNVSEIDEEQIRALLFEADLIDQQFRKKKVSEEKLTTKPHKEGTKGTRKNFSTTLSELCAVLVTFVVLYFKPPL